MPKFAANLTMLFNEHPFLDRFEAAAKAGFRGVEFLSPYALRTRHPDHVYFPPQRVHLFHEGRFVGPYVYASAMTIRPSGEAVNSSARASPPITLRRSLDTPVL